MILAEDTTNPTFYAYFRGFMALVTTQHPYRKLLVNKA